MYPCICKKCEECGKIIQPTVATRGVNTSCGICDVAWCKGTHNRIIKNVFEGATKEQLDDIKKGSAAADHSDNQTEERSYIHAMRKPDQKIEDAIALMREFFISNIGEWNKGNGDWCSLGEALHPIMDAYAPTHRFDEWDPTLIVRITHVSGDFGILHPDDRKAAEDALSSMYQDLKHGEQSPGEIFDKWLNDFKEKYNL